MSGSLPASLPQAWQAGTRSTMSNKFLKYLFYLSLFSLILGPLGKVPLAVPYINIYFSDLVIAAIGIAWLMKLPELLSLLKKDKIFRYFSYFVAVCLLSLIFTPINLLSYERIVSALYLLRVIAYFMIYPSVVYLTREKEIKIADVIKYLAIVGFCVAVIGWLQYFLYPDLRNLFYLGWDPHLMRIFSTFFDPNFLGLILLLSLIALFFRQKAPLPYWFARIFVFMTLLFTYSRSSYLALICSALFYSTARRKFLAIMAVLVILLFSILLLPRPAGEGVKLERVFSIEQRIDSWKLAITMFKDHPLLGVGFNTIRFAKREYGLPQDFWRESHSGAGFESSYLFVGATVGIIGFIAYIFFLWQCFRNSGLFTRISLVAIMVHAFFLNTLFFPWVMLWMWVLLGIRDYKSPFFRE